MKIELLPVILFGIAFVLAVIAAVVLLRLKRDDQTKIKDDADYQDAERPFIDNLNH